MRTAVGFLLLVNLFYGCPWLYIRMISAPSVVVSADVSMNAIALTHTLHSYFSFLVSLTRIYQYSRFLISKGSSLHFLIREEVSYNVISFFVLLSPFKRHPSCIYACVYIYIFFRSKYEKKRQFYKRPFKILFTIILTH